VLDGYSRAILSWDIKASVESLDVGMVLWNSCNYWSLTNLNPRIISDNGSQFLTSEFKGEVATWIKFYNFERLHSSIQYIAPMDVINNKSNGFSYSLSTWC